MRPVSENTALVVPDEDDDLALAIVVEAEDLVVNDQVSFEYAATVRRTVKDMIEAITGKWKPLKQAQDAAKKKILDQERAELATPERVLAIVNKKLDDFETERRAKQEIAEARAVEEAKRLEALRPAPVSGEPPRMPVVVPAAVAPAVKVAGLSFTPHYDVVEDVQAGGRMALIQAVGAKEFGSPMLLEPNLPMLKDLARVAKGDLAIPGYKVVVTQRPRG